ncbi:hypothetical protein C0J52_06543 [Blattella germanica]|nr:hypothetical protein C0J52_06543 [Blattella germanica]
MAKTKTIHVMKKDVQTLQQQMKILTQEMAGLKHKMLPYSAVPSKLHISGVTESSDIVETLPKRDQEVIEKHLKTLEAQMAVIQGLIKNNFKIEKRLTAVESSLPKCSQGLQPDNLINQKDLLGNTQLMHAVESRDVINIAMLLKRRADANIGHGFYHFPLHYAAIKGFTDVCALLLLVGNADVNAKHRIYKETTLHFAALNGHADVVELLLKCGADVHLKSSDGLTAFDKAVVQGHQEVVRLLKHASNRDMFSSNLNKPLTT